MRNLFTKLAVTLSTVASICSGAASADTYGVQLGVGYRQDSLLWKMEDLGETNPRSESDLHFKDLEIVVVGAKFKGMLGCSFYTRASFDYGWIVDGSLREELTATKNNKVHRFDHNGILSEGTFTRGVVHNKEKGNSFVWDLNVAVGVPFHCWCDNFQIAPMIGFSYDRQQIKIHNGERFFINLCHHTPRIHTGKTGKDCHGSTSTFKTAWWGPWIGFDFSYTSQDCWSFFGEFELHVGRAERRRETHIGVQYFDLYKRTKCFWGTTTRIGANYVFCENWYAEATIGYSHWMSNQHRDRLIFSSGTVRVDAGYIF